LGRAAVCAVFDAYTGLGEPTCLTDIVLEHIGHPDIVSPLELKIALTTGSPEIPQLFFEEKELAPMVIAAAKSGDRPAGKIVRHMAERIAGYIIAGAEKLGMTDDMFDVVFAGSVARDGYIMSLAEPVISEKLKRAVCVNAGYEPVWGLVFMMMDEIKRKG